MWSMTAPMKAAARDERSSDTSGKNEPEKRGRKASKEVRQQQLIEATIDSLAKRGYSETTMADVADGAGLSRGIVNFHFESKDKLLVATLQYMADEYAAHWRAALAKAGADPARQLRSLVAADFDRSICNRRKLAAWCAFWGEAKSRPTYLKLCADRDHEYADAFLQVTRAMIEEGGYEGLDAELVAQGLSALTDGLWLDLLVRPESMSRERAKRISLSYLADVFPRHFSQPAAEG